MPPDTPTPAPETRPLSPQPDQVPAPHGPDVTPPVQPDATPISPTGPEIDSPPTPEMPPMSSPPEVSPGITGLPEV